MSDPVENHTLTNIDYSPESKICETSLDASLTVTQVATWRLPGIWSGVGGHRRRHHHHPRHHHHHQNYPANVTGDLFVIFCYIPFEVAPTRGKNWYINSSSSWKPRESSTINIICIIIITTIKYYQIFSCHLLNLNRHLKDPIIWSSHWDANRPLHAIHGMYRSLHWEMPIDRSFLVILPFVGLLCYAVDFSAVGSNANL